MARKKVPLFTKFLIIASALVVFQVIFYFLFSPGQQAVDLKQGINSTVSGKVPSEEGGAVVLQMALSAYKEKHTKYPEKLDELVSDGIIQSVPIDPKTAKQFVYAKNGEAYTLGGMGAGASKTPAKDAKGASKTPPAKGTVTSVEEQEFLIASLDKSDEAEKYTYDPSGKKDPFRSFDFSPREAANVGDSPLEQFTYDQLTLTAVLLGAGDPKAIVEDKDGRGRTVTIGTPVGMFGGKIAKIEKGKLVILETTTDFTGEQKTQMIEMYLHGGNSEEDAEAKTE